MQKLNKFILVCFVLFFNDFEVKAQFAPVDWNNTLLDESLIDCKFNSSTGNYLLSIISGYPSNYPNNYSYIFDYNHILYLTDSGFNLIDSIYLDRHGKYRLAITKILKATSESIIVVGPALDTTTYLFDAIVIWLNGNLEVEQVSIYGEPELNEHLYNSIINHQGNIILNQGYLPAGNPSTYGVGYYREIDMQGNIIYSFADTCSFWYSENIYDYPEIQKYAIVKPPEIYMVDYLFNLDSVLNYNCNVCYWYSSFLRENKEILLLADYMVFQPMPPAFSDVGIFRANIFDSVYDSMVIGTPDTNDRFALINEIAEDDIYLACSKNINFPIPTDSWISLYKANLNGNIYWDKHFGGYGEYITKKMITRTDGNLVIFGDFWDFHKYNGQNYHRDIFILKADVNGIISGKEETGIQQRHHVFPNPFRDELTFDIQGTKSCSLLIFDLYGNNVYSSILKENVKINFSFLPKGLYFYSLIENSVCRERGKLIKH